LPCRHPAIPKANTTPPTVAKTARRTTEEPIADTEFNLKVENAPSPSLSSNAGLGNPRLPRGR
jgi:hypothetical protein